MGLGDYVSDIFGFGGNHTPEASGQELEIRNQEADQIKFQNILISRLLPDILTRMGLTPRMDENGRVVDVTPTGDIKGLTEQESIQSALQSRVQNALRGDAQANPFLERMLQEEEIALDNRMRRHLGTGWETSTPGSGALADFTKRRVELRNQSNLADISMGTNALTQHADILNRLRGSRLNEMMQVANVFNPGIMTAAAFGGRMANERLSSAGLNANMKVAGANLGLDLLGGAAGLFGS